jgi:acetylornithine/succinyldiaminopimelate/putrescine aminotransferase
MMIEIERAEGVFMYSPAGKRYFDLVSGVSVSNTGHRHPEVVEAIKKQVDHYLHLMVYGELIQSPQVILAERVTGLLPAGLDNCFFVNSGSEAVEGALKLAKRYTGRSRIIYFRNSYHGSTHGALSVQGNENFKNSFRPLLPDTWQIEFNDFNALDAIDNQTACVIAEPVQAEAGVICPAEGFLEEMRKRCDRHGALLILDEAQTGFGRTGTMFAIDRYNVVPDIIVLAKAIGGGMPLGAFISSREIMSSLISNPPLGHITTFGGHPVSCAAGIASLQVITRDDLVRKCNAKSTLFKNEIKHPLVSGIRGEGLLLAVKLQSPELLKQVISRAPEHGLLLDYFLFSNDTFRVAPPLTISEDEILEACKLIRLLLDETGNNIHR